MFKASIFLVAAALITLAYGWVSGIDAVLYASIGFSAVAGLALLGATIADRKKYPREEPLPRPRQAPPQPDGAHSPAPQGALRPEPQRVWSRRAKSADPGAQPSPGGPELSFSGPEKTYQWSEEEEFTRVSGVAEVGRSARSSDSGDFRSRLAEALSASDPEAPPRSKVPSAPPPPRRTDRKRESPPKPVADTEEVEQDWIRIDDLPGISEPPTPPGGLSPARKTRKPRTVGGTGAPRSRRPGGPAEGEPDVAPGTDDAVVPETAAKGPEEEPPRPRIRPRKQS